MTAICTSQSTKPDPIRLALPSDHDQDPSVLTCRIWRIQNPESIPTKTGGVNKHSCIRYGSQSSHSLV